jgi:hypothetical protein
MSLASKYLTWDGDPGNFVPPRRPSTDDLGGSEKLDDQDFPPDDETDPTADGWNQSVEQIAALSKVAASCKLRVHFTAGTPAVTMASGPGSAIAPGVFTVTDMGAGKTKLEWSATRFPTAQCSPTGLTLFGTGAPTTAWNGVVEEITNGIIVHTFDGNTPTDVDFSIELN